MDNKTVLPKQHFILKEDGKIYWIEKRPKEPIYITCRSELGNLSPCLCAAKAFDDKANRDVVDYYDDNCPHRYKAALQSAIDSAVEVSNQKEVSVALKYSLNTNSHEAKLEPGTVYSLLCSVEKKVIETKETCLDLEFTGGKTVALVTFSKLEPMIGYEEVLKIQKENEKFEPEEKETQEELSTDKLLDEVGISNCFHYPQLRSLVRLALHEHLSRYSEALFERVAHGDDEHREWLRNEIRQFTKTYGNQ